MFSYITSFVFGSTTPATSSDTDPSKSISSSPEVDDWVLLGGASSKANPNSNTSTTRASSRNMILVPRTSKKKLRKLNRLSGVSPSSPATSSSLSSSVPTNPSSHVNVVTTATATTSSSPSFSSTSSVIEAGPSNSLIAKTTATSMAMTKSKDTLSLQLSTKSSTKSPQDAMLAILKDRELKVRKAAKMDKKSIGRECRSQEVGRGHGGGGNGGVRYVSVF